MGYNDSMMKKNLYSLYEYKDGDLLYVTIHDGYDDAVKYATDAFLGGLDKVCVVDEETGIIEYTIGK